MGAAVHQVVLHAKMVARGQGLVARGAGETAQVVDGVSGAHDHLGGRDAEVAAGTSLHREPSGRKQWRQGAGRSQGRATSHRGTRGLGQQLPKTEIREGTGRGGPTPSCIYLFYLLIDLL